MTKPNLKFALVMAFVVTSYVSFVVVAMNAGFGPMFLFIWLRSWLVAFSLVFLSLLFLAPRIRKFLEK